MANVFIGSDISCLDSNLISFHEECKYAAGVKVVKAGSSMKNIYLMETEEADETAMPEES